MKKAIYVLVSILLISSCGKVEKTVDPKREETVISGKIINYEKYQRTKILNLRRRKSLGKNITLESFIESDGSFEIRFVQFKTEDFLLEPFTDYYIYSAPGDSIYIEIDLDNEPNLLFFGDSKKNNENINSFYRSSAFDEIINDNIISYPQDKYISFRDSLKRLYFKKLEEFKLEKQLSDDLYKKLKASIINNHYIKLFEYGSLSKRNNIESYQTEENRINEDFKFHSYLVSNLKNDINNSVSHSSLSELLDNYGRYLYPSEEVEISSRKNIHFKRIIEIIKNEENSILKENLLYKYGYYLLNQNDLLSFELYKNQFRENIISDYLWSELFYNYQNKLSEKASSPLRIYNRLDLEKGLFLDSLIRTHLGKVIYVDFWATWCSPCISDMKKSKELSGNDLLTENVAIIYVCTGKDELSCKKLVEELEISGIHVYLAPIESTDIMKAFNNSALPFQIIINKKGEIVAKGNRFRLHKELTRNLISELLLD